MFVFLFQLQTYFDVQATLFLQRICDAVLFYRDIEGKTPGRGFMPEVHKLFQLETKKRNLASPQNINFWGKKAIHYQNSRQLSGIKLNCKMAT